MLNAQFDSIKKLVLLLSLVLGILAFNSDVVYAKTCDRYKIINDDMRRKIGKTDEEVKFEAWHSSGGSNKSGYWKFYRTDLKKKYPNNPKAWMTEVQDKNVPTYFSGTSRNLPKGIVDVTYELPDQVKKFISIYGADSLGLKIDIGKDKSIKGKKISYNITSDSINIKFYGILNYVRPNMWQALNPSVANQMKRKVYTPQVLNGYGDNRISIGGSPSTGGDYSIKLNEKFVREAYKKGEWIYVDEQPSCWATFKNGGNNGVIFRFPIEITYYDNRAYTKTPSIESDTYKGWVKVGSTVNIRQEGSTNRDVPLVKINSNFLEVNRDGNTSLINARILHYSSESENYIKNGNINVESVDTFRNKEKTISSYNIKVDSEGEYKIRGYSDLTHYRNNDFNDPLIYRESSWSGGVTFKGDGKAPTGNVDINYNSDFDKLRIEAKDITDNEGSGVKKVWIKISDRRNGSNKIEIELKRDYEGNYIYEKNAIDILKNAAELKIEVFAEDNVGNSKKLAGKDIDVLKFSSNIYRDLAPHEPIFFTREKGTVKVNMTGYFDKIKIIFPDELKSLSVEKSITPKLNDTYDYNFKIPSSAKSKEYKIHVIGYKGNKIKEEYPTLKIQGQIESRLRTRIRCKGVDD